jgi:octaprenyl-diphosphate synthase
MDPVLKRIDKRIKDVLSGGSPALSKFYDRSRLKEGKRLRARLFLAFSGSEDDKAVDIASSIELLHAATIIHDDILDNSSTRRGHAALYLEAGIPASVLYGDYLFSEAFRLIGLLKDPHITNEMISALSEVLKGEIMERGEKGNISLTAEEYFRIIEMKSGCLFGVSAKLGALVREDRAFDPDRSYLFGLRAGVAYQMFDDYADYFGDMNGKRKFDDLMGGVVTLPLIDLVKKCSSVEKKAVLAVLGKPDADTKSLEKIAESMDVCGVASSIRDKVSKYLQETRSLFKEETFFKTCSGSDILSWIGKRIDHV